MVVRRPIRLPKQWPAHVKSGVLQAISLASVVLSFARSRATGRRRLQAELEEANTEIALLREELYINPGRRSIREGQAYTDFEFETAA